MSITNFSEHCCAYNEPVMCQDCVDQLRAELAAARAASAEYIARTDPLLDAKEKLMDKLAHKTNQWRNVAMHFNQVCRNIARDPCMRSDDLRNALDAFDEISKNAVPSGVRATLTGFDATARTLTFQLAVALQGTIGETWTLLLAPTITAIMLDREMLYEELVAARKALRVARRAIIMHNDENIIAALTAIDVSKEDTP